MAGAMPNKVTTSKQLSFIFSRLILCTEPAEGLKIWGGKYLCGGHNLSPLVGTGLTDLPKSGGRNKCFAPPLDSAGPVLQYRGALGEEEDKRTLQRESDELSENLVGSAYLANLYPT